MNIQKTLKEFDEKFCIDYAEKLFGNRDKLKEQGWDIDPPKMELKQGIILGFTVDEELTCQGVNILEDSAEIMELFKRVSFCIISEPTMMGLYIAHKGINSYRVIFHGKAVHSSIPEQGTNAIYYAAEFIQKIH